AYFEVELFPRKTNPVYPEHASDEDKKYITWQTAHNDIDMLREKAIKNGRDTLPLYTDFNEMLDKEKPDVLDICTPTYLHAPIAITAMRKGINVISEKPMSLNAAEADEILAVEKETGKFYMTAQVVRFMSPYMYLKKVIETQPYGKPFHIRMSRIGGAPRCSFENWYLDEKRSGHVLMDLMIHDIDYMHYAFGEPKNIQGTYTPMCTGGNCAMAVYSYDGFNVSIETGWFNAPVPFNASFLAVFENGFVELKDGKLYDNGKEVTFSSDEVIADTGINISNVDGYESEIAMFLDCVRNGKRPEKVSPESSAYTIRLIEKTKEVLEKH
ncbi:MAG: Gfo/Idh/MocA family oxidoreductase, partial [Clostridia bacterium]|nr:Gfo/Idh/MocA family oxidoreductase [Clostridia bacterium]